MPLRRAETVAVLVVVVGTGAAVFFGLGGDAVLRRDTTVELQARAPENGNWLPDTIVVERGKGVRLRIRNTDGVTHGFYLPALSLSANAIKPGESEEIWFVPETAGTYPFYCSVWCSDHHMQMRGTLIVR